MNRQAYLAAFQKSSKYQKELLPQIIKATEEIGEKHKRAALLAKPLPQGGAAEGIRQAALAAASAELKRALADSDKLARAVAESRLEAIEAAEVEQANLLAAEARRIMRQAPNLWEKDELQIIHSLIEIARAIVELAV